MKATEHFFLVWRSCYIIIKQLQYLYCWFLHQDPEPTKTTQKSNWNCYNSRQNAPGINGVCIARCSTSNYSYFRTEFSRHKNNPLRAFRSAIVARCTSRNAIGWDANQWNAYMATVAPSYLFHVNYNWQTGCAKTSLTNFLTMVVKWRI